MPVYSNVRYLTADPEDYKEMRAVAEYLGIHYSNLYVSKAGVEYFIIAPKHLRKKVIWFDTDNTRYRGMFKIEITTDRWMKNFLQQKHAPFYRYNFPQLIKGGVPQQLFKELFNSDPKVVVHGRRFILFYSDKNEFLHVGNNRIYACTKEDGIEIEIPLSAEQIGRITVYLNNEGHKRFR